uniref:Ubiquitin-like protease family profile domain-containing protein n=1 Tax=Brassica campestris TaxID=3711 RepID=M4DU03_BRACM
MKKSLDVFDFNEEDELAESASGKLLEKFTNPSSSISPVLQRQRVQSVCQDKSAQKEDASCAEAATAIVDGHCEDAPALATEAEESTRDADHVNPGLAFGLSNDDRAKEVDVDHDDNHGLMFGLNTEDHVKETDVDHGLGSFSCQPSAKSFYAETSAYSQPQIDSPLSDSSSSEEQTDMMSAIDESLSDRSALSDASDSEGDEDALEDWVAERCLDDIEKIDRSTTVIMIPEYVVLKDMPCAASLVGLIILRIRVLLKDEKCQEDMQQTTDIEELKFAVKEHNWPEKQRQINSLHVKYPAVWSADLDDEVEVSGENLHQQKRYFPRFDEPFEEVIYPKGDPDAVSICKRDVELLQPETFVNDTIIDFYINYLCEEWKERHKETSDDISSRFMDLRFVSLELPQQENSYDCGLFLLHYLELFLAEAPKNFSPFKIYNASNFLYLNWFPPAEASLKRTLIEKLIFELLENRSREVNSEQNQSCESPVALNNNAGIEVLSGRGGVDCNGSMTQLQDDQGIEMTLLERSSMKNMQAVNDSGMVLRDLFDSGANNTGSLLGQLQQTFEEPSSFYHLGNSSLASEVLQDFSKLMIKSPDYLTTNFNFLICLCFGQQVDMETGEQFMCLNSGESNFQRITGTAPPRESSWNLSMMPVQKESEADSLSETSKSSSSDSEDICIIEDFPIPVENFYEEETDESPPREAVSLFSVALGPSTDHTTENEELASTQDELVVVSSQDDRDELKQLENEDLGIGDKTSGDIGIELKTNEDLETKDKSSDALRIGEKMSDDLGTEDKPSDDLGIVDKSNDDRGIGDKTIEHLGTEDKASEELEVNEKMSEKDLGIEEKPIEDLGTEVKASEDVGDDCDQKEEEPVEEEDEKRAAKRPRLSSTDEAEEMEE